MKQSVARSSLDFRAGRHAGERYRSAPIDQCAGGAGIWQCAGQELRPESGMTGAASLQTSV
jgi:hypothetical protein